jgi:cytoskeletal protein CcmA (bactofilin family)
MPRDREDYTKPANTFIGQGITVEAQMLSGAESVRVDGIFKGDINLDGYLQLGESGRILGDIHVNYALVAGKIIGNINCRAMLHLIDGSMVMGDIQAGRLIIDKGAQIHGFCATRGESLTHLTRTV